MVRPSRPNFNYKMAVTEYTVFRSASTQLKIAYGLPWATYNYDGTWSYGSIQESLVDNMFIFLFSTEQQYIFCQLVINE